MSDPSRRSFLQSLAILGGLTATRSGRADEPDAVQAGTGTVETVVNGTAHRLAPGDDEVALDVIRDRLGLTGAKRGCGHGACGACTMLVDGVPTATCLLPATSLHRTPVTTVEGLGDVLHPVQKAFVHQDALQCGYCTPGFVVEAVAFYERWREEQDGRPTADQVADALEGHLCRCGAHPRILAAVADACEGRFDEDEPEITRVDAVPKVTGQARYTVDVQLDGMLHAAILRSPHAHATVRSLDIRPALEQPGVHGAIALVQSRGTIRYAGQALAAIAAETRSQARAALDVIDMDLVEEPAVLDARRATEDDAPQVYPSKKMVKKEAPKGSEGPVFGAPMDGNIRGPTRLPFAKVKAGARRVKKARAGEDALFEATWSAHTQSHTTLEPHAAVARWDDDQLTVWSSTQSCSALAEDLQDLYDLKPDEVQVLCPFVGGGFGAKAGLQLEHRIAVELAQQAGRPVKVAYERSAEIHVAGLRPGAEIDLAVAVTPEGELSGLASRSYNDGGVSVGSTATWLHRLMYKCPRKDIGDYAVFTHTPGVRPFRAPGGPQGLWALEQTVDQIAHDREEDPLTLRRRWDENPVRARLYDWAESIKAWSERRDGPDTGRYRRGIGLAAGAWIPWIHLGGSVELSSRPDGLVARSACQDMGNGSKSVVAWAIAERLGIPITTITVDFGDSRSPWAPLSTGSRTAVSMGPAAASAADDLLEAVVEAAEHQLGLSDVSAEPGTLRHAGGTLPLLEVLGRLDPITVTARRRRDPGGYYVPFGFDGLHVIGQLPGSVQLSEVEVDTHTGILRVLRSWSGIGAGRIHVPRGATTQVEGAVVQGVSYCLYEDRVLDPNTGRILSAGLETYRIAGLGDVPEMQVHFDEQGFEGVSGGGVGLSELAAVAIPASIGNAVFHATGWRPHDLPLDPRAILEGLS